MFGYDPVDRVDADVLVATIEACYFAFARLRREIKVNRTCPCDPCRRVQQLDLKLAAHHGAFVEHGTGGSHELVGSDVVLAHRLLKSAVSERTGLRGYALLTQASVERLAIDTGGLRLTRRAETYESVPLDDGNARIHFLSESKEGDRCPKNHASPLHASVAVERSESATAITSIREPIEKIASSRTPSSAVGSRADRSEAV